MLGAMYQRSARIYDLLYTGTGIKDYPAESVELHRIIREANPTARTLLDVACGTGAHLAELRQWYAVEGVDVSPAMLAIAQRRLPDIPLHEGDARQLNLGRTFDAVTCLFSSIGYITEPSDLRSTVGRLADHVSPGGVLILDGWIRPERWDLDHRPAPEVASDPDMTVVRLSFSRRVDDITELEMHHMVRTESGVEYFLEIHRLRLTPTSEYVDAVEAAGLSARVIGDYMPSRDRIVGTRPQA